MRRAVVAVLVLVTSPAHAEDLARKTAAAVAEADAGSRDPDLVPDSTVGGADGVTGEESPGYVAFTFDDGPQVGTTEKVIEALLQYDIPAAFFIVGKHLDPKRTDHAEAHKKLVKKEIELGFLVGNHTYGHAHISTMGAKDMAWQVDHTTKLIRSVTGVPVGLFRPPYGGENDRTNAFLSRRGLTSVKWDLDSRDWEGATAEQMRKKALADIRRKNGGIILFHDTKKVTAKTITSILDDLEAYNCKRLASGKSIIQPVSLHYFLRDGGKRRKVPDAVAKRTKAYRDNLQSRCDARKGGKVAHR